MNQKIKLLISILSILLIVFISYAVGYQVAMKNNVPILVTDTRTFYAKVIEIKDKRLLVEGLSINDINDRGEFVLKVSKKTNLEWRHHHIDISTFQVDDVVSITYKGEIQESSPKQIKDIIRIQLLRDELEYTN